MSLLPEVFFWDGPGYYASKNVNSYHDEHYQVRCVGKELDNLPDVYGTGYGTPHWFSERPENDGENFIVIDEPEITSLNI